uniref:Uncharacterized protein n=1 Tax=Anguilla anguilla TaxID=7936 RepID=A0A0E9WDV1_ANGAN
MTLKNIYVLNYYYYYYCNVRLVMGTFSGHRCTTVLPDTAHSHAPFFAVFSQHALHLLSPKICSSLRRVPFL